MSGQETKKPKAVLIYNGECPICRRSVDYLKKRVDNDTFTFESDSSEAGHSYLAQWGILERPDSLLAITSDRRLLKGERAILEIATEAGWNPFLVGICKIDPLRFILKYIYRIVAKHRMTLSALLRLK